MEPVYGKKGLILGWITRGLHGEFDYCTVIHAMTDYCGYKSKSSAVRSLKKRVKKEALEVLDNL